MILQKIFQFARVLLASTVTRVASDQCQVIVIVKALRCLSVNI